MKFKQFSGSKHWWAHGMDLDSWYRLGLMVWTWTHGIVSHTYKRAKCCPYAGFKKYIYSEVPRTNPNPSGINVQL